MPISGNTLTYFSIHNCLFISEKMWQKYDIESDQLKCNFCTQWFKATLHYANLQRYSLKACQKCLKNFTYCILHPDTYKIYKVLLLDSNITIPNPKSSSETYNTEVSSEIESLEQEIKDRLSQFCEQKIQKAQQEMENANKRLEESMLKIKQEITDKSLKQLQELKDHQDLFQRINRIKEQPLTHWLKDFLPPKATQPSKLSRNASGYLISSRKTFKESKEKEKENMLSNRQPFCKAIKNKVTGFQDSKVKLQSSHYLELPPLAWSRPKSLSKSSTHSKSSRQLDSSYMCSSVGSRQDRDLNQIIKLLENEQELMSYLPFEVYHDNATLKNESKRTQADSIIDLREKTSKGGELIELIGINSSKINFEAYLRSLGCQADAKTVRIIKSGLSDYDFDALLRFVSQHPSIQTLIVTNNKLTELSVLALSNFFNSNKNSQLRHVYLGSNRIHRQRVLQVCRSLNQEGVNLCL